VWLKQLTLPVVMPSSSHYFEFRIHNHFLVIVAHEIVTGVFPSFLSFSLLVVSCHEKKVKIAAIFHAYHLQKGWSWILIGSICVPIADIFSIRFLIR
jgi:hypothetical protein